MKAALISLGSVSSQWTAKAMKNYFSVVDELDLKCFEVNLGGKKAEILYKGEPLQDYDCIYAKGSFRYANILRIITALLAGKTYMPINESAFTTVHDKILTHLKLQESNLPMPGTYLSATLDAAKAILKSMPFPVVMKFPHGTGGKGVMFGESYAATTALLDALTALKQPFLIQEYIETEGADTRAIVVGDRVVASMRRVAASGEKRANIHSGGHGEPVVLDGHTRKIAVDTAKALNAEICGVDILESPKGPLIIEANISPGLQGITKATKTDVANEIAKYLHKKTEEFVAARDKSKAKEVMKEISASHGHEILTKLDFRGERILLPDYITRETKFKSEDEFTVKVEKGKLLIEKMTVGKK